jgi:predicted ABC-type ATPase
LAFLIIMNVEIGPGRAMIQLQASLQFDHIIWLIHSDAVAQQLDRQQVETPAWTVLCRIALNESRLVIDDETGIVIN